MPEAVPSSPPSPLPPTRRKSGVVDFDKSSLTLSRRRQGNFGLFLNYKEEKNQNIMELRPSEFVDIAELGSGFGGIVYKSIHLPSGKLMARKLVNSRISSAKIRKSLAAELGTLQKCQSEYIVKCFGAFVSELQVSIAMEYMDVGSLDRVCKLIGPLPEPLLSFTSYSVLRGLLYLHRDWNIIHRDLKPSNILINSKGQVKLCDFGESIELVNSMAKSLVGTTGYMAPERVNGQKYTVRSDIWSLGITLIELATGRFPYNIPSSQRQSITPVTFNDEPIMNGEESMLSLIELWEAISNDLAPALDSKCFSKEFTSFISLCLIKDERNRPDPYTLMVIPLFKKPFR